MLEKGITEGICHAIHQYAKAKYWDVNSLYGWALSQKLSVKDIKCVEKNASEFIVWI